MSAVLFLFLEEIENKLSSEQRNISRIIEIISPFIPEEKRMDGELEHLKERYTMEVERGIHNKAINYESASGNNFGIPVGDEIADADNADDNYLGDNIELF